MKKLVIVFDGDGVLTDTHLLTQQVIRELFNIFLPPYFFFEEQIRSVLKTTAQWEVLFNTVYGSREHGVNSLRPTADMLYGYRQLSQAGHSLSVVTDRTDHPGRPALSLFQEWQKKYALDAAELHSSDGRSKASVLSRLKPDVFVDDDPDHIREAVDCGVPNVFLLHQPYNAEASTPPRAKRAIGWVNLTRSIHEIAEAA